MEPIKKEMWKCPICGNAHDSERLADLCLYEHIKERCINHDFGYGFPLSSINYLYGMHWDLSEKQKEITKDSCFKIPHLQCCDEPAYKISHISYGGKITVSGRGSWSGYYSSKVRLGCLEDPRPKEELFIDSRA
jgi:hypothetical protein